jgi:hypothetical protein
MNGEEEEEGGGGNTKMKKMNLNINMLVNKLCKLDIPT